MADDLELVASVGGTPIWRLTDGPGFFFYEAGMAVDTDGAPNAYHPAPDDDLGLDDLASAGDPVQGNWWALATDPATGDPVVQGPDDPALGFYVSTTSLVDSSFPSTDTRHDVNATEIPYLCYRSPPHRTTSRR